MDPFDRLPAFIGVVHLVPLPGSPRYAGSMSAVLEAARYDAAALAEGGAHALIVENFGDAPFFAERVPPETVAAMALALRHVAKAAPALAIGANVLRNDARAALALCATTPASFLRVNVHTGTMVTDQGPVTGRAAETLRERERLAPDARLFADVHVKHAQPLAPERLADAARDAHERGLADALIVSGAATGDATSTRALLEVREAVPGARLLVGSGLDEANAAELLGIADGAIVGTALKEGGDVARPVDVERVRRMRALFDAAGSA